MHSQRRYVHYYESISQNKRLPEQTYLTLERIRMHTIPTFKKGGSGTFSHLFLINTFYWILIQYKEPWFSIFKGGNTIYYSDPVKGKKGNQVVDFKCGTVLTNDIKVEFYHKNLKVNPNNRISDFILLIMNLYILFFFTDQNVLFLV